MKIMLTRAQWKTIKALIKAAEIAEASLGRPVEIAFGDQKIEIVDSEIKITLIDAGG